jgi:hypothetical protein
MPLSALVTVTLHALSPLAAWPWLVAAAAGIDNAPTDGVAELVSKEALAQLAEELRVVRQKRREASEKALAYEAVRRGLTPAATAAGNAWMAHRAALHGAKQTLEEAKEERDKLWAAARAADQRVRDAHAAYAVILRGKDQTGRADQEAREARKHELFIARTELDLAVKDAERAERVLATNLDDIYRRHPQQKTMTILGRLLGASENELMVLMGLRRKRELTEGERDAFVRRVMAGEPVGVLAEEYHISRKEAYLVLAEHRNQRQGDESFTR